MTRLHAYVISKQVLYLGISDTPAWVVVKANECELSISLLQGHHALRRLYFELLTCGPNSCSQEWFDSLFCIPRPLERCVPRHGS